MALTGDEGGFIPLDEAAAWTANFRNSAGGGTKAHFFGKQKLRELMEQPKCVGIRVYHAIDINGDRQLVMVGVDANERDIIDSGLVLDQSFPCPNRCDFTSPLS